MVLGHEYTGVVREVGRGVGRSLVGRTVGCEPSYGCGDCAECAAGRVSQCAECVASAASPSASCCPRAASTRCRAGSIR